MSNDKEGAWKQEILKYNYFPTTMKLKEMKINRRTSM
jgi:hypothetical protein